MARYRTTNKPKQAKKSKFPIWLILAGVGVILIAVFAFVSGNKGNKANIEVTGAPSIKVSQDSFDYGEVKLGVAPILTEVTVTNVGDQTLQFTEAPYVEVLEGC